MIRTFINISERYGDAVPVTVADYLELNPDGDFMELAAGIFEFFDNDSRELIAKPVEEWEASRP